MAEWECPVCGQMNEGSATKCSVCDYKLDKGSETKETPAATPAAATPAAAAKKDIEVEEINKDELFKLSSIDLDYNVKTKESVDRFIKELDIPTIEIKDGDPIPEYFCAFTTKGLERFRSIEIVGLSSVQQDEITELRRKHSLNPYNPTAWNTKESLDSFIAKEFPTCPENTYLARDPEIHTVCRRILEEEGKEGFIIGENHWDYIPKKFLIDNMAELKRCGVRHLFLEHFFYNTLIQRDLTKRQMTRILNDTLESKVVGSRGGYDFRELILSAWANDISVIGIDTDRSYTIGGIPGVHGLNDLKRKARITAMNVVASTIIKNEKKGKYVALVGELHLSKIPGECLGLADILNVPSMLFNTHSGEKPPQINIRDLEISDVNGSSVLSRVDYVYYSKEKRRANFKGGRRTRKYRLPVRRRKTKLKSRPPHKRNK